MYYLAGQYDKSIADCHEVLKRNPRHFGALSGMGQIYLQLEDDENALHWYRRALENPNMMGVEMNVRLSRRGFELGQRLGDRLQRLSRVLGEEVPARHLAEGESGRMPARRTRTDDIESAPPMNAAGTERFGRWRIMSCGMVR